MSTQQTPPPHFSEAQVRQRFSQRHSVVPLTVGDGHLWRKTEEIRPAAVLVPMIRREDGLAVLLTRRTAHLHDHAGQISFPGGRAEPEDPSLEATALREAEEEIGLQSDRVEVLGTLHEYVTVTGYRVTPVVGLVGTPFEPRLDAFEVAEVFEVPLAFFLDPRNHQRNSVIWEGGGAAVLRHPLRQALHLGRHCGHADEFVPAPYGRIIRLQVFIVAVVCRSARSSARLYRLPKRSSE